MFSRTTITLARAARRFKPVEIPLVQEFSSVVVGWLVMHTLACVLFVVGVQKFSEHHERQTRIKSEKYWNEWSAKRKVGNGVSYSDPYPGHFCVDGCDAHYGEN